MTRIERMLVDEVAGAIRTLSPQQAARLLLDLGLLNYRACERRAIRTEIERLERLGTPRCGAMHAAAETFCCSYEKVRGAFYQSIKN